MNLTQDEIEALKNSQSVSEWNEVCDQVKAKRNGNYPPDWYEVIIKSGILAKVNGTAKPSITFINIGAIK
jgi:hypothetical protein